MDQTTQTTLDEFIAVVQDTAELAVSIAKIETSKAEAASEKTPLPGQLHPDRTGHAFKA